MANIIVVTKDRYTGNAIATTFESPKVAALESKCSAMEEIMSRRSYSLDQYYRWKLDGLGWEVEHALKASRLNIFSKLWGLIYGTLYCLDEINEKNNVEEW